MEIELKMAFTVAGGPELFWHNPWLAGFAAAPPETLRMYAEYLDTREGRLQSAGMVYRVREEGPELVATLKYDEKEQGGVARRQETNWPLTGKNQGCPRPDASLFGAEAAGQKLLRVLDGAPLENIFVTDFLRRRTRIDYIPCAATGSECPGAAGAATVEIAVDTGWIIAGARREEICELEAELLAGDAAALPLLRDELAAILPLRSESRSKYARGIELARGALVED